MAVSGFNEGVKAGGLTSTNEISVLLCYILDNVEEPVSRKQLEEVLLGEELVNYFIMAESLMQLLEQGLVTEKDGFYTIGEKGKKVAQNLAKNVPHTVRDLAVRGLIRALQFSAKTAANKVEIVEKNAEKYVFCSIDDNGSALFKLELYMPNQATAKTVENKFKEKGDIIYKLVLAALTENSQIMQKTLQELEIGVNFDR